MTAGQQACATGKPFAESFAEDGILNPAPHEDILEWIESRVV